MRPLSVPALLALLAFLPPAATAQTITHSFEGRFGVTYSDRDGRGASRAISGGEYRMTIDHPFDNGWSVGFSVGIAAGNFTPRHGFGPSRGFGRGPLHRGVAPASLHLSVPRS